MLNEGNYEELIAAARSDPLRQSKRDPSVEAARAQLKALDSSTKLKEGEIHDLLFIDLSPNESGKTSLLNLKLPFF